MWHAHEIREMHTGFWWKILMKDRLRLKCDGTCAETRFRLLAKWTGQFKSAGAPVQLATGRRGAHISGSNAGNTMFRGSVNSTGYPLHLPVSPSFPLLCITVPSHFNWTLPLWLPLPCVTVCHHISTGLYYSEELCVDKRVILNLSTGATLCVCVCVCVFFN